MTGPEVVALPLEDERPDLVSSSREYGRRFEGPGGRFLLERQTGLTLRLVQPQPGDEVLDVGGGHAQLVGPLRAAGCRVTVVGSDPSCRTLPDQVAGPDNYRFVTCNLYRLPFADATYDVVFAYRMLSHLADEGRFLGELCRVARDRVVVDYTPAGGLNAMSPVLFGVKRGIEKDTRHYRMFRPSRIRAAFGSQGFEVEQSCGQFMLPMAVHRLLQRPAVSRLMEGPFERSGLTQRFGSPRIAVARRRVAPRSQKAHSL